MTVIFETSPILHMYSSGHAKDELLSHIGFSLAEASIRL